MPTTVTTARAQWSPAPGRPRQEAPDRVPRAAPPDPTAALLRALVAEQARQRDTLAAILGLLERVLERGRGPRDAADVALLVAMAEAVEDRAFTSAQLLAHADADPALREALTAADLTTGQELGCVCRRLEGLTLAGFRLARVGDLRGVVLWKVQVCEG